MREEIFEMFQSMGINGLKLLLINSANYKNQSDQERIKQYLYFAFKLVVDNKWWHEAILLLSAKINFLSTIPSKDLKALLPYKEKILSAQNLQYLFLTTEFLTDALDSKGKNNLGIFAHAKSGLFKPQVTRSFLGREYKSGSLGRISQELLERKKLLGVRENRILARFINMTEIDNSHRGVDAMELTSQFHEELKNWLKRGAENIRVNPIDLILETVLLMADQGAPANHKKKIKYTGTPLIPIKIHFKSPKVEDNNDAVFKLKYGVHIKKGDAGRYPVFTKVIHELVHLLCKEIYKSCTPEPKEAWLALADLIKKDLENIKEKKVSLPEDYIIFDYFSQYPKEQFSNELPSRLTEFLIENFMLPGDENVFSKKTIKEMHRLYAKFTEDIFQYKKDLEKTQKEFKHPGRFQLFDHLKNKRLDKFCAVVTPENHRAYNLMPLHLAELKEVQYLVEVKGFRIDAPDKFKQLPMEAQFAAKRFDVVVYLMEKTLQKDGKLDLPRSIKINERDSEGKTLLMHAVQSNRSTDLIRCLLETYQADASLADYQSHQTALDYALSDQDIPVETVILLADHTKTISPSLIKRIEGYQQFSPRP